MPATPPTDVAAAAALIATLPCTYRRLWGSAADPGFGLFPWKGQNIDTPAFVTTKWTTDDDVHSIP